MPTKILNCDCTNDFQDKTYGAHRRVKNEGNKGYSCTVCGRLDISVAAPVKHGKPKVA